jgi:hypothetical protein
MGKRLSFLWVVLALLLGAQPVESQEFPFSGVDAYQALLRAGYTTLERFASLLVSSKIPLLADGGGDGGGGSGDGGGGSGDGGGTGTGGGTGDGAAGAAGAGAAGAAGTGDGTGDSSSAADAAAATSDAAATDASATDAAAAADAATTDAATTNAAADNTSVTDPTTVTNTAVEEAPTVALTAIDNVSPLDAIQAIATTDPRGGEIVSPPVNNGIPGGAVPALGGPGAAPVDVAINAVIVSAAQSPWDAIRRAPGVRNVIITGGIIALGKTPIPGEIPGGGPQPAWLRLIPDLRLLNGSAIPPVVPNVIDVRIMNCPIKIEDSAE